MPEPDDRSLPTTQAHGMTQSGNSAPFRWAVLGTGPVVRKFVLDLRQLGAATRVEIVASRRRENAQRFAQSMGIPEVAEDYAQAARHPNVDGVYIATPPALHEAHALLAIEAGKAVLLEKPFALDAGAARRIAAQAQAADVFCMEAMWTRFQPLVQKIQAQAAAGVLGTLTGFEARFMAANKPDPNAGLFDAAQGGGALMHRGVYPLSLARFLLGPVTDMKALAHMGSTGVDEDVCIVLKHHSGAVSNLRAGLRAAGPDGATLFGTRATLHIQGPIWRPTGATLTATTVAGTTSGKPRRFEAFRESSTGLRLSGALSWIKSTTGRGQTHLRAPFSGNGYHHQAQAVIQAVAAGQSEEPNMPLAQSIEIMDLIDAARAQYSGGMPS